MRKHGLPSTDRPHDKYFKATFSIREIALEMLQLALPVNVWNSIVPQTLTLAPDSFVDEHLREVFSDLIYVAQTRQNNPVRVCFLFEHKSRKPTNPIHIQLLNYLLRIWEEDIRQQRGLTLTIPVVVYNGKQPWAKESLQEHFPGLPPEFLPYLPDFEHQFVGLQDIPDTLLFSMQLGLLRNVLLALKHAWDDDFFRQHFVQVVTFAKPVQEHEIVRFLFEATLMYLQSVSSITKNEYRAMTIEQLPKELKQEALSLYEQIKLEGLEEGLKQGLEQGLEQGIEQGLEQGLEHAVIAVLRKFPQWTDEQVAELLNIQISLVRLIREEIS